MDLSNARIIEWEESGEAFVGARTSRRRGFQTVSAEPGGSANYAGFLTELEAENVGARVVAEFPAPSLAEIVGDAPAFLFTCEKEGPCIAYRYAAARELGGDELWHAQPLGGALFATVQKPLHGLGSRFRIDLASVVPLYPREVVS